MDRVCTRCTQRRKRCDRRLPKCSFCARHGLSCEYPSVASHLHDRPSESNILGYYSFADSATPAERRPQEEPQEQSETPVFPRVYFLDAFVFQQCQFELPKDKFPIPSYFNSMVGDSASIQSLGANYFNTVHTWMPIVSRLHFHQYLINQASQSSAVFALLVVAMRLIVWLPPPSTGNEDYESDMYQAAKHFYRYLETAGLLTLPMLQAGILIALYEFGHAIYPSAYFTIGACARYGSLLGINHTAAVSMGESLSWIEVEERRRVWWAILILDRSMNLGNPLRSLATEDPNPNTILPADDDSFDQGTSLGQEIHTLSSASPLEMGRFARFAQATHLLGRVFTNVSDLNVDHQFRIEECIQLYRTLSALVDLSIFEGQVRNIEFCTQKAICYCALLILREARHSNDAEENIPQDLQSVTSAEAVARKVAATTEKFHSRGSIPCQTVSPFILHTLYRSAAIFTKICRQSNNVKDSNTVLAALMQSLELLRSRWGAANTYVAIVEAI